MRQRPLRNRVSPTGEILADPARGTFMGNRGILHNDKGEMGHVRWRHKAWIICELRWKDWHREVMTPGAYTELFFLDEAVAMAAGHRPCALCRRGAFNAYRTAVGAKGPTRDLDDRLHTERAIPRKFLQRRHAANLADLPDGTMILWDGRPALVRRDALLPFSMSGYEAPLRRPPSGPVTVLTPETSVQAMREGYVPRLHPTAL